MKKKRKYVIIAVLLSVVILMVLCILIFFHRKDIEDTDGKIHIPRNIQLEEGETIEIILPITIVNSTHGDIDDIVEETKEYLNQEDVYANEDGTITEVLTQEQLEQRIRMTEDSLINKIDGYDNIEIIIDKNNFNKATYYVTKDCPFLDWVVAQLSIRYNLVLAQIYSGTPHDEWYIDDRVIYEDRESVMFEFHLEEGGSWGINESQWNERMQELSGE